MAPTASERERVKAWFEAAGLSVTDWANEHGFDRAQVYAFLNGRTSGRRGVAHQIAVALRLKAPPGPLPAGIGISGNRNSTEELERRAQTSHVD
ncbi:DNA-binding protein [Paucibacter sp. R3-3]|uniref:DNA-binding protein n=1 Tax=Roseateles agri TaxID=3098619 RepID=A0ABU5DSN2_9BURK|nr:DNA-binding protein [Paucibacter sp. R3-3]MDY0748725.1 DNA-binding protein [Paucibacter sp. R3-3]